MADNTYVDIFWGPNFLTPILALVSYHILIAHQAAPQLQFIEILKIFDIRVWITLAFVSIWAFRLAFYIGCRHQRGVEDSRYAELRQDWLRKGSGQWGYYWRAFFFIFMPKALLCLLVNSASLFIIIFATQDDIRKEVTYPRYTSEWLYFELKWTDYSGMGIWLFGFLFEAFSDCQLSRHINREDKNKPKFLKTGLWRYSRHPNYFGEAVLWWGIWLIALGVKQPYGWCVIYAPILIFISLRFISGVPLIEEKYKDRIQWECYCRETNCFVPCWYKEGKKNNGYLESEADEISLIENCQNVSLWVDKDRTEFTVEF